MCQISDERKGFTQEIEILRRSENKSGTIRHKFHFLYLQGSFRLLFRFFTFGNLIT